MPLVATTPSTTPFSTQTRTSPRKRATSNKENAQSLRPPRTSQLASTQRQKSSPYQRPPRRGVVPDALLSTAKCGKKNAKPVPPQKLGYASLSKAMTGVEAQLLHDDAVVDGVSTGGADGWSKDATELGRPVVGKAHFPLKLPRPRIDPVDPEAIGEPELQDVPIHFLVQHLLERSDKLLRASTLYRPVAMHAPTSSSSSTIVPPAKQALPSTHLRFAMAAPPPDGLTSIETPDICLAVRPARPRVKVPGRTDGETEVGRLIPAHSLVFATQCSHFRVPSSIDAQQSELNKSTSSNTSLNTVTSATSSLTDSTTSTATANTADSVCSSSTHVGGILAGLAMDDMHLKSDSRSPSQEIEAQADPLQQTIDLPIVHLALPYPSLLPIVQNWLYNPQPAHLLAYLLDLPSEDRSRASSTETARPPSSTPIRADKSAVQRLGELSVLELVERLKRIHALWNDVVALGMGDEKLWKVMEKAWDVVIGSLHKDVAVNRNAMKGDTMMVAE